jgi:hypothetical protein
MSILKRVDNYNYKEIDELFEDDQYLQAEIRRMFYIFFFVMISFFILTTVCVYFEITTDNFDFGYGPYLFGFFMSALVINNTVKVNKLILYIRHTKKVSRSD